jgi:hypothetical protein
MSRRLAYHPIPFFRGKPAARLRPETTVTRL